MKKELIKMNIVFVIAIGTNWLLHTFGNTDSFYIILLMLLIPLNIYLVNKK